MQIDELQFVDSIFIHAAGGHRPQPLARRQEHQTAWT
jgi:hypothetical protein